MTTAPHLINRLQNGEKEAFRELVEAYNRPIYFLSLDLTGNHQDAQDLSQEVFMKAYRSVTKFRGDAKLSSWLYRITVNTFIDQKRRKNAKLFALMRKNQNEDELLDQTPSDNAKDDPERNAESNIIQSHINQALDALSKKERSVFVLRHYQDLAIKEISEMLNIAEGTVKSLLFRAIKKLQKKLAFYRSELDLEN
jgi:RNA polymerase sigma-70 factor (ECF subfamily)